MANFGTHIATAGFLGAAYATAGHLNYGMPLQSSILAGGLCAVAGVLPDVDSDNAVILRESLSIVSVLTPLLLLNRFQEMGMTNESIVLAVSLGYVIIRFGVGEIIRRLTVHRGMWHSIPAALTVGLVIYYICDCADDSVRLFKTGAAVLGFLWHLTLDEFYSIERRTVGVRLKKSFGTALKFFGPRPAANLATYGAMFAMIGCIAMYPPDGHSAHAGHPQPADGRQSGAYSQPTAPPYSAPAYNTQQFPEQRYLTPGAQSQPQPWGPVSTPDPWPSRR